MKTILYIGISQDGYGVFYDDNNGKPILVKGLYKTLGTALSVLAEIQSVKRSKTEEKLKDE